MSINIGGGKQSQKIPQPTAEEQRLQQLNSQIAELQLQQLQQGIQQQNTSATSSLAQMQAQLEEAATKNLLARVTGQAPILTPEQQASLDQMFNLTSRRATEDLQKFGQEQADMRGMSTADSPIGNEMLRQQRELQEGLAATKTKASLDLGNSQDLFNQNLANFQAQLRQQAYQNRLALASTQPSSFALQNSLLAQRLPFVTTKGSQWGTGLSGQQVGAAAQGLSYLG